jgi:hypothetical protein
VFELGALDVFLNLAIPQSTFKGEDGKHLRQNEKIVAQLNAWDIPVA